MIRSSIRFDNVSFRHEKSPLLFHDLSISLGGPDGRIVALMGPSGVGKSTFCDLVLGTCVPVKGSIDHGEGNGRVGSIPQRAVLFEELDLKANITCLKNSRSLGETFDASRFDTIVGELRLQDVSTRAGVQVTKLSGGEAQRLMLARIGMVDCRVLVLDEPCSFLDNRVKETFLCSLRETVRGRGILALMVTHVWDEAAFIADDILTFHGKNGRPTTVFLDTVTSVLRRPPTIDAMYSAHWPMCKVFPVEEVRKFAPAALLCSRAKWVALFEVRGEGEISETMLNLWRHCPARDISTTGKGAISRSQHAYREPIGLVAATFTDDECYLSRITLDSGAVLKDL
jgi:molybdate transport system ATP-binding protein